MTAATKTFARAETFSAGAAKAGLLDMLPDMEDKNARAGVKYSLGNGLDWHLTRCRERNITQGLVND